MKKNTIVALVVAFVMVGAAVGFIVWDVNKSKNKRPENPKPGTTPGTTPGTETKPTTPTAPGSTTPATKNNYTDYEKAIADQLHNDLDGLNITHDLQLWYTLMLMSNEKIKNIVNIYKEKYNAALVDDLKSDVISFTDNYAYYKKIKTRLEAIK